MNLMIHLNKQAYTEAEQALGIEKRKSCVELAVASQIAFRLTLPSQPVDGLIGYYTNHCNSQVAEWVSKINEEYPVNIDKVLNAIYRIWVARYNMVHPQGCYAAAEAASALLCKVIEAETIAPDLVEVADCTLVPQHAQTIGLFLDGKL